MNLKEVTNALINTHYVYHPSPRASSHSASSSLLRWCCSMKESWSHKSPSLWHGGSNPSVRFQLLQPCHSASHLIHIFPKCSANLMNTYKHKYKEKSIHFQKNKQHLIQSGIPNSPIKKQNKLWCISTAHLYPERPTCCEITLSGDHHWKRVSLMAICHFSVSSLCRPPPQTPSF